MLYRGQWTAAETAELATVVQQLGGEIAVVEGFTTPVTIAPRHCLYLRKVAATPREFPRAIGIPTQDPLGAEA